MDRPITTLFMLMSVDGKISTGASDVLDVDRDFPKIPGVREGLHQYYEIEQTTDLWSFNTGRVQAKMGVNEKETPAKTPVSFVLLDNHHLTERGVRYFCARSKQFVLITSNAGHPAFRVEAGRVDVHLDFVHDVYVRLAGKAAGGQFVEREVFVVAQEFVVLGHLAVDAAELQQLRELLVV